MNKQKEIRKTLVLIKTHENTIKELRNKIRTSGLNYDIPPDIKNESWKVRKFWFKKVTFDIARIDSMLRLQDDPHHAMSSDLILSEKKLKTVKKMRTYLEGLLEKIGKVHDRPVHFHGYKPGLKWRAKNPLQAKPFKNPEDKLLIEEKKPEKKINKVQVQIERHKKNIDLKIQKLTNINNEQKAYDDDELYIFVQNDSETGNIIIEKPSDVDLLDKKNKKLYYQEQLAAERKLKEIQYAGMAVDGNKEVVKIFNDIRSEKGQIKHSKEKLQKIAEHNERKVKMERVLKEQINSGVIIKADLPDIYEGPHVQSNRRKKQHERIRKHAEENRISKEKKAFVEQSNKYERRKDLNKMRNDIYSNAALDKEVYVSDLKHDFEVGTITYQSKEGIVADIANAFANLGKKKEKEVPISLRCSDLPNGYDEDEPEEKKSFLDENLEESKSYDSYNNLSDNEKDELVAGNLMQLDAKKRKTKLEKERLAKVGFFGKVTETSKEFMEYAKKFFGNDQDMAEKSWVFGMGACAIYHSNFDVVTTTFVVERIIHVFMPEVKMNMPTALVLSFVAGFAKGFINEMSKEKKVEPVEKKTEEEEKLETIEAQAFETLAKRFGEYPTRVASDALGTLEKMVDDIELIERSPVLGGLRDCVVGLTLFHLFPKEIAQTIWDLFGKPREKTGVLRIGVDLTKTLIAIIKMADGILAGKTVMEVLFPNHIANSYVTTIKKCIAAEEWLNYANTSEMPIRPPVEEMKGLEYENRPKMDVRDYLIQISHAIHGLDMLIKSKTLNKKQKDDKIYYELILNSAKRSMDNVINELLSRNRIPPVFVGIIGTSQVGKSTFIELVYACIARAFGIETYSKSMVYSRPMCDEFMSGLNNKQHYIFHYSEMGQLIGEVAKMNIEAPTKEVLSLIDNQQVYANMAKLEDKGTMPLYPIALVCDSNEPTLGFKHTHATLGAIMRRMIRLTIRPKTKYSTQAGALRSDIPIEEMHDVWDIHLERFSPTGECILTKQFSSSEDFFIFFYNMIRTHITGNMEVNSKFSVSEVNTFLDRVLKPDNIKCKVEAQNMNNNNNDYYWVKENKEIEAQAKETSVKKVTAKDMFNGAIDIIKGNFGYGFLWLAGCSTKYQKNMFWTNFIIIALTLMLSKAIPFFTALVIGLAIWAIIFIVSTLNTDAVLARKMLMFSAQVDRGKELWYGDETDAPKDLRLRSIYLGLLAACLALTTGITALSLYNYISKKKIVIYDIPQIQEQARPKICSIEDNIQTLPPNIRKKNVLSSQWISYKAQSTPNCTGDLETLSKAISANLRHAVVYKKVGNEIRSVQTMCFGLYGNKALFNNHCFDNTEGEIEIRVAASGREVSEGYHATRVDKDNIILLGVDLVAISLGGTPFRDIRMHILDDMQIEFTKGMIEGSLVDVSTIKGPMNLQGNGDKRIVSNIYTYYWPENAVGKCGTPLLLQVQGGCFIGGFHIGGHDLYGFSEKISKSMLEKIELKKNEFDIVPQCAIPDLVEPNNPKHCANYEDLGTIEVIGKVDYFTSVNQKSAVRPSPMNTGDLEGSFRKLFEEFGIKVDKEYGAPIMKPQILNGDYVPYNRVWRRMASSKKGINKNLLIRAAKGISDRFVKIFTEANRVVSPYGILDACNGLEEDAYFGRINCATSAGYGWKNLKKELFDLKEDLTLYPKEELLKRIEDKIKLMSEDISPPFIFKGSLKDEITSASKIQDGKTRMFYAMAIEDLIICRMYLGSFFANFVELGDKLCSSVGVNAHTQGGKWAMMFAENPLMSDWDHKDYDIDCIFDISECMARSIYETCKKMGYSDFDLRVLRALLTSDLFAYVVFCAYVILAAGLIPSGSYATAEKNSIRGMVMLLLIFMLADKNKGKTDEEIFQEFWEYIHPAFYGDDSRNHLQIEYSWFNAYYIRYMYGKYFGQVITSARKDSELSPFTTIGETIFLKRSIKYRKDLHRWVLPLLPESILKSLEWILPSKSISQQDQLIAIYDSAQREMFFHLNFKDFLKFREKADKIVQIAIDNKQVVIGEKISTPQRLWEDFFVEADPYFPIDESLMSDDENSNDSDGIIYRCVYHTSDLRVKNNLFKLREECINELKDVTCECEKQGYPYGSLTSEQIRRCPTYISNPVYAAQAEDHIWIRNRKDELEATIKYCDIQLQRYNTIYPQSDETAVSSGGPADPARMEKMETFVDMSGAPMEVSSRTHSNKKVAGFSNTPVNLDSFFERPVLLTTITWTADTDVYGSIDLWDLYLADPTVRAKLRNVSMIRGDMVVDVSCSGNPFLFGGMAIAPVPLAAENAALIALDAAVVSLATNTKQLAKYVMNCLGAQLMEPHKNAMLRFVIPFVSPMNAIRLFNNLTTALGAATNFTDAYHLCDLRYSTVNQLHTTSATATNASIAIYAHLINVELGPPSATVQTITTQSKEEKLAWENFKVNIIKEWKKLPNFFEIQEKPPKRQQWVTTGLGFLDKGLDEKGFHIKYQSSEKKVQEKDERAQGPIEKITSRLAHLGGALSKAPIIGPYALASKSIFSDLSSIAGILGFSTPTMNTPPHRFRNYAYDNQCNLIGYNNGYKMTMDPRQEVTISPAVVGDDIDYMTITALANLESLLTSSTLVAGQAPLTPLVDIAVHPRVRDPSTSGMVTLRQPSWIDWVATLFRFWRATITFRIQIICSAMHKMKFGILYEPNIRQSTLITSSLSTNKNYMRIIDIQETTEIEFDVEWSSAREWLLNVPDSVADGGTSDPTNAAWYEAANGFITMFPLTALQSPNNTFCYVNVYIRSKDLRVTCPTDEFISSSRILYQSDENVVDRWDDPLHHDEQVPDKLNPLDYDFMKEPIRNRNIVQLAGEAYIWSTYYNDIEMPLYFTGEEIREICVRARYRFELEQQENTISYQSDEYKGYLEPTRVVLNPTGFMDTDICENSFGEQCVSLRALLHRFWTSSFKTVSADTSGLKYIWVEFPIWPVAAVYGSNSQPKDLFAYMRTAFVGMRGGLRKRIRLIGMSAASMDALHVQYNNYASTTTAVTGGIQAGSHISQYLNGSITIVPNLTGGIEIELPYYSNNHFAMASTADGYTNSGTATYLQSTALRNYSVYMETVANNVATRWVEDTAIADDFSFLRPIAPPPYGY